MIKIKWKHLLCSTLAACTIFVSASSAANLNQTTVEAYNAVIFDTDVQQGFHATVDESTTSAKTGITSKKKVDITATGFDKDEEGISLVIKTTADNEENTYYYKDGSFYTSNAKEKIRTPMTRAQIGALVNMNVYLSLTSNSLSMLYSSPEDNDMTEYGFSATDASLGDYKQILLDALAASAGSTVNYLQGTMLADKDGHIKERTIDMDYSLKNETGESETFHKEAKVVFDKIGSDVKVDFPDLSGYTEAAASSTQAQLKASNRKIYTTADVNIRSAGSVNASIIGSAYSGTALTETGTTSDGWTQIDFNGITGYVSSSFVSTTAPAQQSASSTTNTATNKADTVTSNVNTAAGTMYTTTGINVRAASSTSASIIGSLAKGDAVTITGTTSDGWTRIAYANAPGFVSSQYLTWTKPASTIRTGYVKGVISDISMYYMTVSVNYGDYYITFNKSYAYITPSLGTRGLQIGDVVGVSYTQDGDSYTADVIEHSIEYYDDYEEDSDYTGGEGEYYTYTVSGSVNWYDYSSQTLCITSYGEAWDDYSFYIGDATLLTDNYDIIGADVTVDYQAPAGQHFEGMYALCVY